MAVLDFDSHYDQVKGETFKIVVRGEEFELPPDLPMVYVVLNQDPEFRENMSDALHTLMCLLFGTEKLEGWLVDGGMGRDEYAHLLNMVCEFYFSNLGEAKGDGDPKAPVSSSKEKSSGNGI